MNRLFVKVFVMFVNVMFVNIVQVSPREALSHRGSFLVALESSSRCSNPAAIYSQYVKTVLTWYGLLPNWFVLPI